MKFSALSGCWYDVSLCSPGTEEWDEPVSVLALSPINAAELRLKEDAVECDVWLGQEWDAHVTETERPLERSWYFHLTEPKRRVMTTARQYYPENDKEN
jgi:hypothetical protein